MIITDDGSLAARLRSLRHQGVSLPDYKRIGLKTTVFESYEEVGFNFRMTDIQAAIGLVQLERLPKILERRRLQAMHYQEFFVSSDIFQAPIEPNGHISNWQRYMVGVSKKAPFVRDQLMRSLEKHGVPTRRSVMASHLEPAYSGNLGTLPTTELAFAQNFLLPVYNEMTTDQQDYILDSVKKIVNSGALLPSS